MKLSTRSCYGTRALIDIAMHADGKPALLRDVSRREEIPSVYLEHVINPLISGGIVRSTRGAKGGVCLARVPEEISLSEVVHLLEGSTAPVPCVDNPGLCPRHEYCVTIEVWTDLKNAIDKVLEGKTIADLVESQKEFTKRPSACMYYI